MRTTTTLLFAAAAAAATTTQSTANLTTTAFANYYVNFGAPIASVIAAEPTAATYHIWCDAGDDDPLYCNLPSQGITVTAGPATWAWSQPMKPASGTVATASFAVACSIDGTTRAVCTRPNVFERWWSVTRFSRTDLPTGTVVETVTGAEAMGGMWGPLTVTAGAEKLLVAAAAAASGSEATATTTAAVETAAATTSSSSGTGSSRSRSGVVVQWASTSGAAVASRTTGGCAGTLWLKYCVG